MEDKNDDIINETEKLEEEQNKEEFVLKELEEEQNKEKFVHEEIEESKKEEKDTADKIIEVVDNMVNTKDLT
ncbi:MAG: hypothetical protein GX758_02270, partial [Tenericutes bacterium]|nr:hypothetical protein [Mycoplasmatota bacterium]